MAQENDQERAAELLVNAMKTHLLITLRGLASITPGVPPETLIMSACKGFAAVIGMSYVGDDDGVRELREKCRVAFSAALHQAPVIPLPKAAQPPPEEPKQEAAEAA